MIHLLASILIYDNDIASRFLSFFPNSYSTDKNIFCLFFIFTPSKMSLVSLVLLLRLTISFVLTYSKTSNFHILLYILLK